MSDEPPSNYDASDEPIKRFALPGEPPPPSPIHKLLPPPPVGSSPWMRKPDSLVNNSICVQLPQKPDLNKAATMLPSSLNPLSGALDEALADYEAAMLQAASAIAALPSITIIIPTRLGDGEPLALAAARKLAHPAARLEIIVARGKQPSVQRNTALRAAKGDLIYFLDDDSLPPPDNLRRALAHFADPKVVMVGGPNLCPPDAPPLEQAFATVMGTWLAFGPSRARYTPVGKPRASGEKELILCNLMGRRDALLAAGGFDEALYPNEENALMDELQKRGGVLIYDPEFIVHRRPRRTLGAFCKMLMNYGRGRAEQFRLHPTLGSAPNFVPPLFLLYLVLAPFLPALLLWPLALYALAVLAQTIHSVAADVRRLTSNTERGTGNAESSQSLLTSAATGVDWWRVAPLIALSHIFYGLGFWKGLFTRPQPKPLEQVGVTLETISLA